MNAKPKDKPDSKLRIVFEHYRVFGLMGNNSSLPRKGRPPESSLFRYERSHENWKPYERGGKTVCKIVAHIGTDAAPIDVTLAEGVVLCSMFDMFDYRKSKVLAFKRALISYFKTIGMTEVIYTFASACDRWGEYWLIRDAFFAFEQVRQADEAAARQFNIELWMIGCDQPNNERREQP